MTRGVAAIDRPTALSWSVGDDPKFARALRGAGLTVNSLLVRAHDTTGPTHTHYTARVMHQPAAPFSSPLVASRHVVSRSR